MISKFIQKTQFLVLCLYWYERKKKILNKKRSYLLHMPMPLPPEIICIFMWQLKIAPKDMTVMYVYLTQICTQSSSKSVQFETSPPVFWQREVQDCFWWICMFISWSIEIHSRHWSKNRQDHQFTNAWRISWKFVS